VSTGRLLIYPDSHIWDALYDQHVDPKSMIDALAAKNATLVLSYHVVFEIAKIFLSRHLGRVARGIALFSYLKQFVDIGIPETKQLSELLTAEAYALENDLSEIDPFATVEESAISKQEIAKLASGLVEDRVKEYVPRRIKEAEETRDKQIAHLAARPKVKAALLARKKAELDGWLRINALSPIGAEIVCDRMHAMLGPDPTYDYALAVLLSPSGHIARGLVRADLYYNWRCAHGNSVPRDLMPDMLHVLQAIYCDVYVTAEIDQAKYASLLLTPRTKIAIYDAKTPIDQWLMSLV
jgi:hypothetical protein